MKASLLKDGSAAVSWIEFANQKSQFKVRRLEPGGARSPATAVADMSGNRYPRIAQHGEELLFAWAASDKGALRVRTARASLVAAAPGGGK